MVSITILICVWDCTLSQAIGCTAQYEARRRTCRIHSRSPMGLPLNIQRLSIRAQVLLQRHNGSLPKFYSYFLALFGGFNSVIQRPLVYAVNQSVFQRPFAVFKTFF